jgi:hypothetical protein
MRPANDIVGIVWNPVDRCPIANALISLKSPTKTLLELKSNRRGKFRIPGLATGSYKILVEKKGYLGESFDIQIPHRGNLHGLHIDLVEIRVRILEVYRSATIPLLPKKELWACWTPRELMRYASSQAGRRQISLEQLTILLEGAYWSITPAEKPLLDQAQALARTLPRTK